ncbi:MAG: hypothetical protein DHS20C16_14770 [Phycisphaerae bacterium]|nr:MAG: hypothetical protein DHS20C16_14770 [Phycisphaerae bacterium]
MRTQFKRYRPIPPGRGLFSVTCGALFALFALLGCTEEIDTPADDEPGARRDFPGPRPMNGRPNRNKEPNRGSDSVRFSDEVRSFNGVGNNREETEWGAVGAFLIRLADEAYDDGVGAPSGVDRPNARAISNTVAAQDEEIPNSAGVSDFVWQWGQFLDHDITETPFADPAEEFNIAVPTGDPWFDPFNTGTVEIPLNRSVYEFVDGVRQQFNAITAFIDGSAVYGSELERAEALRTLDGTGRLATSDGDLLPFNTDGEVNVPDDSARYFLAGDVRSNEQVGLTAMHTVFVREHNYWAEMISAEDAELTGEQIYQEARAIVTAEMQVITYREFLPALLGPGALEPYSGYSADINPTISNEFATASYRLGHSMLSSVLLRLNADGSEIDGGNIALADAFFNPEEIVTWGIDPILRGLAAQEAQEIDTFVVDGVRNFLFGAPGAGGLDLVALNIQRGRDHGLPSLNEVRTAIGLDMHADFASVNSDPAVQARLAAIYDDVGQIDLWVGGLAEEHVTGALVGETILTIVRNEFERLRDGDRFWYERYLPAAIVQMVEGQTLATIIRRNTDIGDELQDDVFRVVQ